MELVERVLTMKEAAEFLDITYGRFKKKRYEYKIPFFRKGDRRTKFFDKLELEKFKITNLNLSKSLSYWSKKDIEKLKQLAGTMRFSYLANKLNRSIPSIKGKLEHLGVNQKNVQGEWTVPELAVVLNVSCGTIGSWIQKRGLKARTAPFDDKININVKTYLINLKNLFLFFRANPEIYDVSKLNKENKLQLNLQDLPSVLVEKLLYCKRCDKTFWTKLFLERPRCPFCNFWVSKYAVKGKNEKGEKLYNCSKCLETFWILPEQCKAIFCPICKTRNKIYSLDGTYK